MLRAYSNLPSIASPAITICCAIKLSLNPTPSSSARRRISPTFPILSQTLTSSSSTSFLGLKRVLRLMDHPRASASYSTGSGDDVGRELLVQHLLLKEEDKDLIFELQKRLVRGEDLSDLAVEYSICPSKSEGGMLGWVRKGQMVPEFEEAAFNAPVNKVVKCKTQFGWHLLQVLSEREESVLKDIQPEDLHTKLQDPDFLEDVQLIDVREPHEVERASLSGFQVLPLQQFGSWGPEVTTKLDPQKDTYVLCHHGVRSLQVAKWLQTQGFRKIYNIAGGIHAYAVQADSSIPTY